jgi:hypothetical protein
MAEHDQDAIAAFIQTRGVTRCPTVCAAPTQGTVAAADRLALRRRAEWIEQTRKARVRRPIWTSRSPAEYLGTIAEALPSARTEFDRPPPDFRI